MARKVLFIVLFCAVSFADGAFSEMSYRFDFQTYYNLGRHSYNEPERTGCYIGSLKGFDFPIDALTTAFTLSFINTRSDDKRSWLTVSFSTNLFSSNKKAEESWFLNPDCYEQLETLFQHAYSEWDKKMAEYNLDVELTNDLVEYKGIQLAWIFGFKWHKYKHDLLSYEGWFMYRDEREEEWADQVNDEYQFAFRTFYAGTMVCYDTRSMLYGLTFRASPLATVKTSHYHNPIRIGPIMGKINVTREAESGVFYEFGLFANRDIRIANKTFKLSAEYTNTMIRADSYYSRNLLYDARLDQHARISTEFDYRRNRFGLNLAMDF